MEAIADANSNLETKTERKTTGFKSAGECMRDQVATIESGQFGILFKTYGNKRFKTASSNCLCWGHLLDRW